MKRILSQWGWGFVCAVTVLMSPIKSSADFLYLFDHTWTGTAPAGPAPWISELFQDLGGGAVSLTISNSFSGTEYLQQLLMNLNPTLDPTKLIFTKTAATAGLTLPTISTGANSLTSGGDGMYDISLSFSTANMGRFAANNTITYTITDSAFPTLSTLDFAGFLSAPKSRGDHGPFFLGGAHIVSIGANLDSGWDNPSQVTPVIPVPEPSGALLFSLAAGLCVGVRRFSARR